MQFDAQIDVIVNLVGRKPASKRRTTLTLPSDSLLQAEKTRRDQILDDYRTAFTGFSEDELAVLDGVILEPVAAGKRR